MARKDLDDLPDVAPVPGFPIVPYEPGFEAAWLEIHLAADHFNTFDDRTFERQFGTNHALLAARQRYVRSPEGALVGTATAWFTGARPDPGSPGLVHWVAVDPRYQGRGLSKPLLLSVCRVLRDLGHESALLKTSLERTAALNLYVRFGFDPVIESSGQEQAWKALFPQWKSRR